MFKLNKYYFIKFLLKTCLTKQISLHCIIVNIVSSTKTCTDLIADGNGKGPKHMAVAIK